MTIHARLSEGGTAIGESALCAECLQDPKHREFADAADSMTTHRGCPGNETLACVICGTEGG